MKTTDRRLVAILSLLNLLGICSATVQAERITNGLSEDWKFIHQDVERAAAVEGWEAVTVPHTWNNLDGQKGKLAQPELKDGYFRGACWYARALDIPSDWKTKRVFVRFEAASIVAQVYLNGELIGEHRGAFTAFCFELTSHLRFGQANELRVRVDNSLQKDVPPISGDFNMDGGLYRPVELIVTDPVCISPLDFASSGVYVTTQTVNEKRAKLEVKTLISNGDADEQTCQIETVIKDAAGNVVSQFSRPQTIGAGQTVAVKEMVDLPDPHLWNGRRDPYLYSVTVMIHRGNDVVDSIVQSFGLRTMAITQDQGFLLNGKPYPIHGVNRHQDSFDKGWALLPEDHERDAGIMLDMGVTAVRNTHYPQSGNWHDLADKNGLLMWDEVSLVELITDSPEFTANSELEAREMVHQLYNHPSIAFWGIFNELGNRKGPTPDGLLEKIKNDVKELDSSRLIVCASDHSNKSYNKIADWTCFNTYPGWYGAAPASLTGSIKQFSAEVGKRVALSEYGAGGNPFQHQEGPITWRGGKIAGSQNHPEEYQAAVHEADYAQMAGNDKLWGSFIWVMFDFPVGGRHEGGRVALNDKGMVTQDRLVKKDAYFFYQANWADEPMVYIASRRLNTRTMPTTQIKVYSNCPTVELKVNGVAIGSAEPDKVHVFRWENVPLQMGDNQIDVTGTSNGKTVSDGCSWKLVPPFTPSATPNPPATAPASAP